MNDTPVFEDVPEFSPDGQNIKPGTAKYSGGFVSNEMLPYDWANWFFNRLTKNGVIEQGEIESINAELKGVLAAHGVTPNPALTNQLAGVFGRYVSGDNARATVSITNANTPVKSGFFSLAAPYTNGPTSAAYYIMHIQQSGSDSFAMQIASLATGNNTYVRTNNNGTWSSWAKLWNADNDGAGSGLDADTLDTYHAGHATGQIPVSDGAVNATLNAAVVAGVDPVNGNVGTEGQHTIGVGERWVIPKGTYMIVANTYDLITIDIYSTTYGLWLRSAGYFAGGLVISDGVNYSFNNLPGGGQSVNMFYRKLA